MFGGRLSPAKPISDPQILRLISDDDGEYFSLKFVVSISIGDAFEDRLSSSLHVNS